MSQSDAVAPDARLRILQALAKEMDHRSNDRMLVNVLDAWGYRRSPDYVRAQVHKLQEVGGVTIVTDNEHVLICEITQAGLQHVARRAMLPAVRRPEPGE